MLPNSNCKLPNIEVTELAVWPCDNTKLKACVLQAYSCHFKSERAWAISLTPRLRRKQKCAARPGRRPRCGDWQNVEQGINLNASNMCWQMGPIKVELAWESTQRLSKHSDVFCKFSNYTEWWWCVKVQTVHSIMSRNAPKAAHSTFWYNWVEHSFATFGGSCAPDGAHQECMCKTDQLPCQLHDETPEVKPTLTCFLVCIRFRMKLITIHNLVSEHCGQHIA